MEIDSGGNAVDSRPVTFRANANLHVLAEVVNMPHVPKFLHNRHHAAFAPARSPVKHGILLRLLEFVPRRIERKMHLVCNRPQIAPTEIAKDNAAVVLLLRSKTPLLYGQTRIRHNQIHIELATFAKTATRRALPLRIVKAKESRFQFRDRNSALRASELRALQAVFFFRTPGTIRICCIRTARGFRRRKQERHKLSVRKLQGSFNRFTQTAHVLAFQRQAVNHHFNRVLLVTHQQRHFFEPVNRPVHTHADKSVFLELREFLAVFALALLHNRRHHQNLLIFVTGVQVIDNLVHRLRLDDLAALGAMRHAQTRKHQTVMVQNFDHRPHRTARVPVHRLLVNRNRRRNSANALHVRMLHAPNELARIRRKRLHKAALPFLEYRIESKARLARARNARHHDNRVAGNRQIDMAKIMFVSIADFNGFRHAPNIAKDRETV